MRKLERGHQEFLIALVRMRLAPSIPAAAAMVDNGEVSVSGKKVALEAGKRPPLPKGATVTVTRKATVPREWATEDS